MDILHQLIHSARHACDNTHTDCILCQDTVSNGLGKLAVHAVKARRSDGDYYDEHYEIFIYRKCVIEINGDVFGLDFKSGVNNYKELNDTPDLSLLEFFCVVPVRMSIKET